MPGQRKGLIAILDALGAASYSDTEIDRFLESRSVVLDLLNVKAVNDWTSTQPPADAGLIPKSRLLVFTFNDTVVIVFLVEEGKEVTTEDVQRFAIRLRAFMIHSFQNRILFRGSMSVGSFHLVDDATNTVMGAAVSDAAAWYDKADWIGIALTPHASMYVQTLIEQQSLDLNFILVDYAVPMRDGRGPLQLKAINWPKAFYVKGLRPKLSGGGRAMLLSYGS
jgi:hypothetical protein